MKLLKKPKSILAINIKTPFNIEIRLSQVNLATYTVKYQVKGVNLHNLWFLSKVNQINMYSFDFKIKVDGEGALPSNPTRESTPLTLFQFKRM